MGPVRNHVKLEIGLFAVNFNSRGFSLRVPDCVVDTGYGLDRPLRIAVCIAEMSKIPNG